MGRATSLEFERLSDAAGPTGGKVVLRDGVTPPKTVNPAPSAARSVVLIGTSSPPSGRIVRPHCQLNVKSP
jgi:hypothetical protein